MDRVKMPVSLIAVVISVVVFIMSWNVYGLGLSIAMFPDAAKSLVTPASELIDSWNELALENGISPTVLTPITINREMTLVQLQDALDSSMEAPLAGNSASAE